VFQITKQGNDLDQKHVDTNWITGDNLKIVTCGLHIVMQTDKELCVYDPQTKKILQLF